MNRGTPEDWMSFEDYQDDRLDAGEDTSSEDDWKSEWQSWFSKETYWHLLGCREDDGWLTITIDNRILIQTSPEERDSYNKEELVAALDWLSVEAERIVEEIKLGNYRSKIENELPFEKRYGLIKRSDLWRTANPYYRFGNTSIDNNEVLFLWPDYGLSPQRSPKLPCRKLERTYQAPRSNHSYT